jgi:hypothetical protein
LETAYRHLSNCSECTLLQRTFLHHFKPKFYNACPSAEMVVEKLKKTTVDRRDGGRSVKENDRL